MDVVVRRRVVFAGMLRFASIEQSNLDTLQINSVIIFCDAKSSRSGYLLKVACGKPASLRRFVHLSQKECCHRPWHREGFQGSKQWLDCHCSGCIGSIQEERRLWCLKIKVLDCKQGQQSFTVCCNSVLVSVCVQKLLQLSRRMHGYVHSGSFWKKSTSDMQKKKELIACFVSYVAFKAIRTNALNACTISELAALQFRIRCTTCSSS